ncbi:MAG: glycosyltransferase [Weeksellaceae bacterium]
MQNPLVSISCTTYNHEPYIRQCLDGFLMQQCDFEFEIVIHDDASTDETQEIIKEYQKKFPDIIKPIFQTENQYSKTGSGIMARYNFPRAQGKYIALCEGDDYWTDPLKLQKQVDILEKNTNIDICSHASFKNIKDIQTDKLIGYWGESKRFFSFEEVIMNFAATAPLHSILIRNKNIELIRDIVTVSLGGHSMTQILYSYPNGLIYLPDRMSVYRVGSQSSISKILFKNDKDFLKRQLKNFRGLDVLSKFVDPKHHHLIRKTKRKQAIGWISTGYTTTPQNIMLILKYDLYKNSRSLVNCLLKVYKSKAKRFVKRLIMKK